MTEKELNFNTFFDTYFGFDVNPGAEDQGFLRYNGMDESSYLYLSNAAVGSEHSNALDVFKKMLNAVYDEGVAFGSNHNAKQFHLSELQDR